MSHKKILYWLIIWKLVCVLIVMDHKWSHSWNFLNKLIRDFLLNIFRSEALFGHPVFSISWFARSTLPWLWLCRGLLCTTGNSGHISLKLLMTKFANTLPLSLYNSARAPKVRNTSRNLCAISFARFEVNGCKVMNFVTWFWYTKINLYSPSSCDCKSIKSNCPQLLNLSKTIGFTSSPFL